ncbi:MAG: addiction module protein [Thiohalospira sp.]
MASDKEETAALLARLPEDSSFEDIQYHLYVLEKVRRGEERAAAEGSLDSAQARERFSQIEHAWSEETARRLLAYRQGDLEGIPIEDVLGNG